MSAQPDQTADLTPLDPEVLHVAPPLAEEAPAEHRSARLSLYAGIGLILLGWLVLYLGYNGAATHPQTPAQMPYVISGGFVGLALNVLGGVMILVHIALKGQARAMAGHDELVETLQELADSLTYMGSAGPHESTNGSYVVLRAGSSYHRPGCRLVANKGGLRHLAPTEVGRRDLAPCRVCKP